MILGLLASSLSLTSKEGCVLSSNSPDSDSPWNVHFSYEFVNPLRRKCAPHYSCFQKTSIFTKFTWTFHLILIWVWRISNSIDNKFTNTSSKFWICFIIYYSLTHPTTIITQFIKTPYINKQIMNKFMLSKSILEFLTPSSTIPILFKLNEKYFCSNFLLTNFNTNISIFKTV